MSILKAHNFEKMALRIKGFMGSAPLSIGIDWGSRMLKAIVLQSKTPMVSLHEFSVTPVVKTPNQNHPSDVALVETIKNSHSVPVKTIATALSGPSVFIKTISLPGMSTEEVRNHLALELDRYFSLDAQDVFWDVYHQEFLSDATLPSPETFLVVAKKESVERQIHAFAREGMEVRFVDVDAFALTNVVTHNYGKQGTWLLAHVGPTGMVMVVIEKGEPVIIRKLPYEAEWYRDFWDPVLLPLASGQEIGELGKAEVLLLEQFLKETQGHLFELIESWMDISHAAIDQGILLSGGYAGVPKMTSTLKDSLSMPVQVLNPFRSIHVPEFIQRDKQFQQAVPLMGVAVGVALRGALSHD